MVKIIHEREVCIGCGSCVALCPKHWEMAEDGKSSLLNSKENKETGNFEIETEKLECNQAAADSCPVSCIKIENRK